MPYSLDELVRVWSLDRLLAVRICRVIRRFERESGIRLEVISGYRTAEEQQSLTRAGRPTAPPGKSTHTTCPATGVDVKPWTFPTREIKILLGRIGMEEGLRWGGGSAPDSSGIIPQDWNHFDLGPRGTG